MRKMIVGLLVGMMVVVSNGLGFVYAEPVQDMNAVIGTIDDQPITKGDLYLAIVQLYPKESQAALNRLVNEIVISKEAEKRKIAVKDPEIKERADDLGITGEMPQMVMRIIKTSILTEKMIIKDKKIKVTSDEVKKLFENNKEKLGQQEQIHLRQIFVLSESEANDILLAIQAGADFAKMAKAKSQDEASREKGGDLGFFSRGMLVPEIENTIFTMKTGETSPVIKTSAGFHILRVEEKKPAKAAKFDKTMKNRLNTVLLNNKIQAELGDWLADLRKKAKIEIR